jgi:hypothetical protein
MKARRRMTQTHGRQAHRDGPEQQVDRERSSPAVILLTAPAACPILLGSLVGGVVLAVVAA